MTDEAVRNAIVERLAFWAGTSAPARPWCDDVLLSDVLSNSLDKVELAMDLEGEFGVGVLDEDIDSWRTLGDVTATIFALRKAAQ